MKNNFAISLLRVFTKALLSISLRKFLAPLRESALRDSDGRRLWMAGLGLSWLVALFFCLFLFIVGYFASSFGVFSFLLAPARQLEPPMWVFILGDARPHSLLLCALIGFIPSFAAGRGGWAWVLAAVGLYPSVLSLAGAWALVLGERLGLWLRIFLSEKARALRTDIVIRMFIALVTLVGAIFLGAAVRDWVQFNFSGSWFLPETRFVAALVGLAIVTVIETVIAMAVFHFRFMFAVRTSNSSRV